MEGTNVTSEQSARPRVLLGASGSEEAAMFVTLCDWFSKWAEVRAVATSSALNFIDRESIMEISLYIDEDEVASSKKLGDNPLHIGLMEWADIMVIAPLSADTLAKIVNGLCDDLLTRVVRSWDYSKPVYAAPAMNSASWNNPLTLRHIADIDKLGFTVIPPVVERPSGGVYGNCAMVNPGLINLSVKAFWLFMMKKQTRRTQVEPRTSSSAQK